MAFHRISPGFLLWLLAALRLAQAHMLRGVEEKEDLSVSLPSSADVERPQSEMIPPVYAEYRHRDGDYEIVVHRVPIQSIAGSTDSSSSLDNEVDPWMKMALAEGVDLNEYNVTYEGGTWETLEEDHRRNLVSVNAWENNNARFCVYERQRRGINGLSWSVDLIQQAQEQASYMAAVQHIEHRTNLAEGVDPGWRIIAENVCQNTNMGYDGAFTGLMSDAGHRENILNVRVSYIGIGVVQNGPYKYMCQVMKGTS
jgi:Cysteine-rich secretory protein family